MKFAEFERLDSQAVTQIIAQKVPNRLGVAIPFNGTRRWYLTTFNRTAQELSQHYVDYSMQVRRRMWEVMAMIFADGVAAIYSPTVGHALGERGEEYMTFIAGALSILADDDAFDWCRQNDIWADCYGETNLLPQTVQDALKHLSSVTNTAKARHYLRYGVFADQPTPDLINRTIKLYQQLGTLPTETQLIEAYYNAPPIPAAVWIGTDQPTLFDVPLVTNGQTALYFLQFPTLYLDRPTWRRLLFDFLFVRGDEESLYPDNVSAERDIIGLGVRRDGYWIAATT